MKIKQQTIFFIIIIIIVLVFGAIITIVSLNPSSPSSTKYNTFATCLKDKGAQFYGAFWCPHCKEQKAEFGSSVKLLPYVECSTPDANDQTQICKDKGIESYPTWTFRDPIKLTEKTMPVVCTKEPGLAGEDPICSEPGVRSTYAKAWLFSDYRIYTVNEPTHIGSEWTFVPGSQARGVMPLENLAKQTSCQLPAETTSPISTTTPAIK